MQKSQLSRAYESQQKKLSDGGPMESQDQRDPQLSSTEFHSSTFQLTPSLSSRALFSADCFAAVFMERTCIKTIKKIINNLLKLNYNAAVHSPRRFCDSPFSLLDFFLVSKTPRLVHSRVARGLKVESLALRNVLMHFL
jgi:hypothetical protein